MTCCLYWAGSRRIKAVMVRIFGFSCADAGTTTAANKKAARKKPCERNGRTCAELPLLRSIKSSSKVGGNASNALADHQAMYVMCALVSVDRFEVVHVAHDAVIVDDAVGSQDIARLAGRFHRHPYVVHLQHGDVRGVHAVLIFAPANVQRQELRF